MRLSSLLLATTLPLVVLGATAHDAAACGGCFVQQGESTQVTGHRMVLATSADATTLWDQFSYSGNPKDFAWVLPIHGKVDIGLSSDALFAALEQVSAVSVQSPLIQCPRQPSCGRGQGDSASAAGTTTTTGTDHGVDILAQEVVGPYETVQLSSEDPKAMTAWLENHGYSIPDDVVPVISAYVKEGFDFLALKLVPGQGVSAMRPVRVTTPGAGATLPLRMVAAGTGAITPITLWVFGQGRYEPKGVPTLEIAESELVWSWDTQSSNYATLRADKLAATGGKGWLVEGAEPISEYALKGPLESLAANDPKASGYGAGDGDGQKALEEARADLGALLGGAQYGLWYSRLHGELSRAALAEDLVLGASAAQLSVTRSFTAQQTVGTPPPCPTITPCDDGTGLGTGSGGAWQGAWNGNGSAQPSDPNAGCAIGAGADAGWLGAAAGLGLAAMIARRRRRAAV
jgi:hypothetical protein